MRARQVQVLVAVMLVLAVAVCGTAFGADDWKLLGRKVVDPETERDTVDVGKSEGQFRRIRVVVEGAPIELDDLKVIFADGSVFEPKTKSTMKERSAHEIDLPGDRRVIKKVTFQYRSLDRHREKATVAVYGR
jgi:hypothetical protein